MIITGLHLNGINTNKDNAGLDAHWGAMMTYDYFLNKHNRRSYDNQNASIRSYVNADLITLSGRPDHNSAYWDIGYRIMVYGKGNSHPFTALDIVAHEIGHGVNQFSAGLVGYGEPGALNEGFSDIWAACVENLHKPSSINNWLIAEEVVSGGLRSLKNPICKTYLGENWYRGSSNYDYTHKNNGVLDYWFYLLVNGGSGTNDYGISYSVQGIGIEKAARIAYKTLTDYLTPTSGYLDACIKSFLASNDLYGYGNETIQLINAWSAVGLDEIPTQISGPDVIPCSGATFSYLLPGIWHVTTGLQIVSGQGTNTITVHPSGRVVAMGTITLTLPNGQQFSKSVSVEPSPVAAISGPDQAVASYGVTYTASPVLDASTGVSYQWSVTPNANGVTVVPNRHTCAVIFPQQGFYTVSCYTYNSCVSSTVPAMKMVRVTYEGYLVSSDPSSRQITVSLKNKEKRSVSNEMVSYTLFNQSTGAIATSGKMPVSGTTMNLSTLPADIYILQIETGLNEYDTHRIQLR